MAEVEVGRVDKFFARPVVVGVNLTDSVEVGDRIRIKGHTTDLEFVVESIQIDNVDVNRGKVGDDVGIKVPDRVRPGDVVYKIS